VLQALPLAVPLASVRMLVGVYRHIVLRIRDVPTLRICYGSKAVIVSPLWASHSKPFAV
jgi:hypothetical protein